MALQESSEKPQSVSPHSTKRSISPEALKAHLPRKRLLPVIPTSIFSRDDAPGQTSRVLALPFLFS